MPAKANSPKRAAAHPAPVPSATVVSVAVVVADRAKSRAWYTGPLGLEVLDDTDHWLTVGRKGAGGRLHLCQTNEFDPKAELEPGNSGILLAVPGDFPEACARWKRAGIEFVEEPTQAEWGWYATIRDPDGNELTVMPAW
ncbi:MAG TPA: VOC family protein [Thermoplasmata archaeon]|jgi:catechol 2,3-dioxygenase-like lactoylglutathione lyase family enzyme|nr:VOC family protein [Thermoplasmata archaeon]